MKDNKQQELMKILKLTTVIALLFIATNNLLGYVVGDSIIYPAPPEEIEVDDGSVFISMVPQYVIVGGFRMDVDIKISDRLNHWLVIGPQFYFSYRGKQNETTNWDDYYYEDNSYEKGFTEMAGFGIDLYHKMYFVQGFFPVEDFYFAYGPMYQNYTVKYQKEDWYEFEEDGVNKKEYGLYDVTERIQKFGVNVVIGYQERIWKNLYADAYMGMGFRYSIFDNIERSESRFVDNLFEFGYSGSTPVVGIRFGFLY